MDAANRFESPSTFKFHRLEYLAGLVVAIVFFALHIGEVRWIPAVVLFVYIDVIGYLPGAIAFRRSATRQIPRVYYAVYNVMHSMVTQGLVIGVWMLVFGPEWALLVVPIHLFADRGVFGNFLKPLGLPFEPVPDARFANLSADLFSYGSRGAEDLYPPGKVETR